jgi:hypothetical protein
MRCNAPAQPGWWRDAESVTQAGFRITVRGISVHESLVHGGSLYGAAVAVVTAEAVIDCLSGLTMVHSAA